MRRIVLVSQNLTLPDDPRVWNEARSLAEAGHDVVAICPAGRGRRGTEILDGVQIRRYWAPELAGGMIGLVLETTNALVRTLVGLMRLRLTGRIDVIHAANPPDTYFLVALPFRLIGTRFVFDQHDLCPELLDARGAGSSLARRVLLSLERLSLRAADVVVTPNESYRRVAIERGDLDPERVVVIRSGRASSPPEPVPAPRMRIGFSGVIGHQDGTDLLLRAFAEVESARPGIAELHVVGDGEAVPALRELADDLGIAHAITWHGWVSREELERQLAQMWVAVSPDADTPFNRRSTMAKVIDYVSSGVATVVADLPESRVTAGDAALYFAPGDAVDLANRLLELIDQPDRARELARRAADRAPRLAWSASADRLVRLYDWLSDPLAAPPPTPEHTPDDGDR